MLGNGVLAAEVVDNKGAAAGDIEVRGVSGAESAARRAPFAKTDELAVADAPGAGERDALPEYSHVSTFGF